MNVQVQRLLPDLLDLALNSYNLFIRSTALVVTLGYGRILQFQVDDISVLSLLNFLKVVQLDLSFFNHGFQILILKTEPSVEVLLKSREPEAIVLGSPIVCGNQFVH